MRTILIFAGTRPEIIKMAPIVRELRARQDNIWRPHFCFTGQHNELATPFLEFFDIVLRSARLSESDEKNDVERPSRRSTFPIPHRSGFGDVNPVNRREGRVGRLPTRPHARGLAGYS